MGGVPQSKPGTERDSAGRRGTQKPAEQGGFIAVVQAGIKRQWEIWGFLRQRGCRVRNRTNTGGVRRGFLGPRQFVGRAVTSNWRARNLFVSWKRYPGNGCRKGQQNQGGESANQASEPRGAPWRRGTTRHTHSFLGLKTQSIRFAPGRHGCTVTSRDTHGRGKARRRGAPIFSPPGAWRCSPAFLPLRLPLARQVGTGS